MTPAGGVPRNPPAGSDTRHPLAATGREARPPPGSEHRGHDPQRRGPDRREPVGRFGLAGGNEQPLTNAGQLAIVAAENTMAFDIRTTAAPGRGSPATAGAPG